MNNQQTRYYNRGVGMDQLLDAHVTDISTISALVARAALLDTQIELVENDSQAQDMPTAPSTQNKNATKKQMAFIGDKISDAIVTYAEDASLPILAAEYDLSFTRHHPSGDQAAYQVNKKVFEKAGELTTELAPSGFTNTHIADFGALVGTFGGMIGVPGAIISQRVAAGNRLDEDIDKLNEIVESIVKASAILALTNSALYDAIVNASKIDDTGIRHIKMRGVVKDKITGAVLPKARVRLVQTNAETLSGRTGKFRFFSLDAGVYSIEVSLDGYTSLILENLVIEPEGILSLVVELER